MKKVLLKTISLLTIFVVLQGICMPVFAEEIDWETQTSSDKIIRVDDNLNGEEQDNRGDENDERCVPYEKLRAAGIATERRVGSQGITRGEFTAMAMRAIGVTEYNEVKDKRVFLDVTGEYQNAGAINMAHSMGIVSGANGLYNPDRLITYAEAVVISVNILGRREEANLRGGYPAGYLEIAGRYDLIKGINIADYNANANAEDVYKLLMNTVESDGLAVISGSSSGNFVYETVKNRNILCYYLNIYSVKGIVSAVGPSNIYSTDIGSSDVITVGEDVFNGNYDEYINFLGMNVEAMYRDNDDGTTLIYADVKNKNEILTISSEDIYEYKQNKYTYDAGNRRRTAKLAENVSVMYNGRLITEGSEEIYNPENGNLTLIDNNKDGAYDVVIISSTFDIIVGAVDTEEGLVYDSRKPGVTVDFENDLSEVIKLVDSSDKTMYLAMIKNGDIITVSKSTDDVVIRGVVSNETVSGKIDKVINEKDKSKIAIDGIEYEVTKDCAEHCGRLMSVGKMVTIKLNIYGKVADIIGDGDQMSFAYVIEFIEVKEDYEDNNWIKLLTETGEIKSFPISKRKKCKIDGVNIKKEIQQVEAITKGIAAGNVIRFRTNEAGEIIEIDTANVDLKNEDDKITLRKIYSAEEPKLQHKTLTNNSGLFGEKFFWNKSETVVFTIYPEETSEKRKYRIATLSYPFSNDGTYSPEAYRCTDSFYANALVSVMDTGDGDISDKTLWVVEDIAETYSEENGEIMMELDINSGSVKKKVILENDIYQETNIHCGDIIRCDEVNGEIIGRSILKAYDSEEDTLLDGITTYDNALYLLRKSYLYDKKDDLLAMYPVDSFDKPNLEIPDNIKIGQMPTNSYVISHAVRSGIEVRKANQSDLLTYLNAGNDCAKIIVRYQYMIPQQLFILK